MGEDKFPKQIKDIIEYLDFIYDDKFESYNRNILINGDTEVLFRFGIVMNGEIAYGDYQKHNIACYAISDKIISLFEVSCKVSQGTFIVLLQEYGIIHNRYVYEAVDSIEDYFKESNEL